ncbi:AAA family ATPase [Enterococcus entomosocium]|uniref:AAA family ATPase n=1 Tax=Enterococcus entomosocium TaxID=3034352 RepID=UPI003BEB24E3
MKTLEELINNIEEKFKTNNGKLYEPYVRNIRFPKYKSLIENTEINFTFPLTVLVGVNGTNKTSILQALYGVPGNHSVGNYWFSTDVDVIEEDKDIKNCLVYSYFHKGAKRNVEVLKTRVNRKEQKDYWEPSRPIVKYGMVTPKKEELVEAKNKSTTRWDNLEKSVVFCDFKDYISAFDMYFYNYIFKQKKSYKTRQDFIRNRSQQLSEVIKQDLQSYVYKGLERVDDNYIVSDEVRQTVSDILEQEYQEIRIVSHKFYSHKNVIRPLKTILMKKNNLDYSEAFAGSGESRLIMLVNDIINAAPNSLVLIDEPEINLHPKAIIKFQRFLLEQILKSNHQIILTTHSHYLVDNLPKEAIKLFQKMDNKVSIGEQIDCNDAFLVLGEPINKKANIIVEDKLVKSILEYCISKSEITSMKDILNVDNSSGGVQSIIQQHICSSAIKKECNTFYVLDGDTDYLRDYKGDLIDSSWVVKGKIDVSKIPESSNYQLANIISEITGVKIKLPIDSGATDYEKYYLERNFLEFWKTNVLFLNSTTPEMAILESLNIPQDQIKDKTGKMYFETLTKNKLGKSPTSDEILVYQKEAINNLSEDSPLKIKVREILDYVWSMIN